MTRSFIPFSALLVLLVFLHSCQTKEFVEPQLSSQTLAIFATTDVHGYIRAWDYYLDKEQPEYALSKAATIIEELREQYPNNILVDAGDWLQGNPFAEYAARVDSTGIHFGFLKAVDAMKYTAVVLGNHEFNFGLDYLQNQIARTQTPIIAANIYHHNTSDPAFTPYILAKAGEFTVGVLGLTTPGSAVWDRPRVEGILDFGDGVEAARRFVPKMYEEGADIIVVLAHSAFDGADSYHVEGLGAENFGKLILDEVPGIHAMVLGHRHRNLSKVYQAVDHRMVPVIEAGRWASHVGLITLEINSYSNGSHYVTPRIVRNIPVRDAEEHPAIVSLVEQQHTSVRAFVTQPIVMSPDVWDTSQSRKKPTPAVSLIHKVQKKMTGAQLSAAAAFTTNLTFGDGAITLGQLAQLYPYENTLYKMRISGKQLRAYIEHSSRYWKLDSAGLAAEPTPGVPGFNYDMISGVNYTINLRNAPGDRISDLTYNGQLVKDEDYFTIAINSYRAQGGGGFDMLADAEIIEIIDRSVREMIIAYLSEKSQLNHEDVFEDNWKLVY